MAPGKKLLNLERVLGLTTLNGASMKSSPNGDIYYTAGCVAVRYSPSLNKQVKLYTAIKSVSCLTVSKCGRYLALGERGHQPCICIYDAESGDLLTRLEGHKHGIGCLEFSPDAKYIVSCGFKHDKQLHFWEWKNQIFLIQNTMV